ncbi:MAG: sel1 repeat family protein [Alphaproteobacteria bacterium]|nr:MAG: sel1 repeat family protein [Alphaproteobacteria bacterium]
MKLRLNRLAVFCLSLQAFTFLCIPDARANAYVPFVPTTVLFQAVLLLLVIAVEWLILACFLREMRDRKWPSLKAVAIANGLSTLAGVGVMLVCLVLGIVLGGSEAFILLDLLAVIPLYVITCHVEYRALEKRLSFANPRRMRWSVIGANLVTYALLVWLSMMNTMGFGSTSDMYSMPVAELEKLAEQGNVKAYYWLGRNYSGGDNGVKKADGARAIKWYRKCAELGDRRCQYDLGAIYYHGSTYYGADRVKQDYAEAYFWLLLASDYGFIEYYLSSDREKGTHKLGFLRDRAMAHLSEKQISDIRNRVAQWKPASPARKE